MGLDIGSVSKDKRSAEFRTALSEIPVTDLVERIVRSRLPFVEMMREISQLLERLKVRGRTTARFVLVGDAKAIRFDFGPQLLEKIATCLDQYEAVRTAHSIEKHLTDLKKSIRSFVEPIRPIRMERENNLVRSADPTERQIVKRLLRGQIAMETHPADVSDVSELQNAIVDVVTLCRRVMSGTIPAAWNDVLHQAQSLESELRHKVSSLGGWRSQEWPLPRRQLKVADKEHVLRQVRLLKEAVVAASSYEDATRGLVDFLNLEIWHQRWRIYEIWTLVRLLTIFHDLGFSIDLGQRAKNEVWSLKFTKDSRPVAYLCSDKARLEVFYQLYSKRENTGDMPDIGVRFPDKKALVILDPKHGLTYTSSDLGDVAKRYLEAFRASVTIVHNYYPMKSQDETISFEPRCTILSDVRPGGAGLALFDRLIRSVVPTDWVAPALSIVAVIDVSGSTRECLKTLWASLAARLDFLTEPVSGDSKLVFFDDRPLRVASFEEYPKLFSNGVPEGGRTDLKAALEFGIRLLENTQGGRSLWLFSDGQDSFDPNPIARALTSRNIRLEVFESSKQEAVSVLNALCRSVAGQYQAVLAAGGPSSGTANVNVAAKG
jgi:hypothetical protein